MWVEITKDQFQRMTCTSYSGGSSWFKSDEFPSTWFVLHGSTPLDARRSFFGNGPDYRLTMERIEVKADAII